MAYSKHIATKAPYTSDTFNDSSYVLWGLDGVDGGRLYGMDISYNAGVYSIASGAWISIGDYSFNTNSGVVVEQQDQLQLSPVTASEGSQMVFYAYTDNAQQSSTVEYGIYPSGSASIPSGATILARGVATSAGVVTSWAMEPVVSVAGHVYAETAHGADHISYDNTLRQLAGNPTNVQDAIDAIPSKLSYPSEIIVARHGDLSGVPVTMNIPFDPSPPVASIGSWAPSANNTVALLFEEYIPGGLITEYIRIAGQFTASPIPGYTGYNKWGIAVELWDGQSQNHGVYHYIDGQPMDGSDQNFQRSQISFNFVSDFGGTPDFRPISETISSYQLFTSARPSMYLNLGPNITIRQRQATFIPGTEMIWWRNPATTEWVHLTRDKDYSIDSSGVVTFERNISGYFNYTYKIRQKSPLGVDRDVRADNDIRAFIYLFLYCDAYALRGSYSTQPVYDPNWWMGGLLSRQDQSSIGVDMASLLSGLEINVSLR